MSVGGNGNVMYSTAPVNLMTGRQLIESTDISSDAFGQSWGHTRTWTGLNEGSQNGNGWMVKNQPCLVVKMNQYYSYHGGIVSVVVGGQSLYEFDVGSVGSGSDATYTPRYMAKANLKYFPASVAGGVKQLAEFRLTDATGNVTSFYDLPRQGSAEGGEDINYSGATYGRMYGGTGYGRGVTNQWYDPATGQRDDTDVATYRY